MCRIVLIIRKEKDVLLDRLSPTVLGHIYIQGTFVSGKSLYQAAHDNH